MSDELDQLISVVPPECDWLLRSASDGFFANVTVKTDKPLEAHQTNLCFASTPERALAGALEIYQTRKRVSK